MWLSLFSLTSSLAKLLASSAGSPESTSMENKRSFLTSARIFP